MATTEHQTRREILAKGEARFRNAQGRYVWTHENITKARAGEIPNLINREFDSEFEVTCLNPQDPREEFRTYSVERRSDSKLMDIPTWYPDRATTPEGTK